MMAALSVERARLGKNTLTRMAPAFSPKKGVRSNRGAADQFEPGQIRGGFPDSVQRMSDCFGWFARRGRNLQYFKASAAKINTIGESAAGIKGDAHENEDCIAR
jgi:hypothetical protein